MPKDHTMEPASSGVMVHSMWRTGSTFLASVFDAKSSVYEVFYEPFHEYAGDYSQITMTGQLQDYKSNTLNHPNFGRSYFSNYIDIDPQTNTPLYKLYPSSSNLHDVYNQAPLKSIEFLKACNRVAEAKNKRAFFGFCRSGTQHETLHEPFECRHLHLWRDPHEQFASYNWPKNDYFIPGTVIQLLSSEQYAELACTFFSRPTLKYFRTLTTLLPARATKWSFRLGRVLANRLQGEECYALFYLSWHLSYHSAKNRAEKSFSLTNLTHDSELKDDLEHAFGVTFDGLRATSPNTDTSIDYAACERKVEKALSQLDMRS